MGQGQLGKLDKLGNLAVKKIFQKIANDNLGFFSKLATNVANLLNFPNLPQPMKGNMCILFSN